MLVGLHEILSFVVLLLVVFRARGGDVAALFGYYPESGVFIRWFCGHAGLLEFVRTDTAHFNYIIAEDRRGIKD